MGYSPAGYRYTTLRDATNTSACAEKRIQQVVPGRSKRKYLRVCGEESTAMPESQEHLEIPPRVRRRVRVRNILLVVEGNTSACAEKSAPCSASCTGSWKYLRVCGEERSPVSALGARWEIPPRVRRRAPDGVHRDLVHGNTSACAEKRKCHEKRGAAPGKYLRVCGEETNQPPVSRPLTEIPPRVRRRVRLASGEAALRGNTSACAEKRLLPRMIFRRCWKYLRVCGEEVGDGELNHFVLEIPPRVRRRGIQSHCHANSFRKYLRVCGEEGVAGWVAGFCMEIPPRVRRRVRCWLILRLRLGNTSACAEKRPHG